MLQGSGYVNTSLQSDFGLAHTPSSIEPKNSQLSHIGKYGMPMGLFNVSTPTALLLDTAFDFDFYRARG
mgnify:CR=1 FL=1